MNRHHPYSGGGYESPSVRRGGSPAGPGPDRSYHRFSDRGGMPPRGRGFGRGRGGGQGNYDANYGQGAYDQAPPAGDMGAYNNYDAGPPQDSFYQNGNFGVGGGGNNGGSPQFGAPPAGSFNQGYGNFEDDAGSGFSAEGGYGNRPPKRNVRREKDDKVHDSIIEERIQRERPCRTLFIRNIKYETNSDDVRRQFEEHGEIKTFFDLISTRGMVFVTYFDLRAAERARERLQGSEISGRPIDVHYSLPRDDHSTRGGDRDQNQQLQGTLLVTLRDSASGQPIDDGEVRRKFQQFGDVKSVKPVGDHLDQRYVEFYDTRACDESYDRLRHQGLQDGVMDIVFAWDTSEGGGPPGSQRSHDGIRDWDDAPRGPPRGRGRGRGRGGRGRGYDEDWDRRSDYGRDRDRRGRYDEDYSGGRGRGGGYNDRFDNRSGNGAGGGYANGAYGSAPAGPPGGSYATSSGYSQGLAPPASEQSENERLEQARKVQQLLAALKQPQGSGASPTGPATVPPPPAPGSIPHYPQPPPNPNPYFATPPPSALHHNQPGYPGPPPPQNSNHYASMAQISTPQPSPVAPPPGLANLPPNILALLQQTAQTQQVPPQQQSPPPAMPYNMPPPGAMSTSLPNMGIPGGGPGYQQLMAYLQSQAGKQQ